MTYLRRLIKGRRVRSAIAMTAAALSLGVFAGTALATEYSAEVTINAGSTFTGPSHAYYEIDACPIATFGVSVQPIAYLFNASGIGNAGAAYFPCVDVAGSSYNAAFSVYNPDPSNARTFWVYGWY